jgi:hypothetical protein
VLKHMPATVSGTTQWHPISAAQNERANQLDHRVHATCPAKATLTRNNDVPIQFQPLDRIALADTGVCAVVPSWLLPMSTPTTVPCFISKVPKIKKTHTMRSTKRLCTSLWHTA